MNLENFTKQLDELINEHKQLKKEALERASSHISEFKTQSLVTRAIAATHRISGSKSIYSKQIERLFEKGTHVRNIIEQIIAVIHALREDINSGYLINLIEVAHADIFSDFLEMSSYLVEKGYKDAAAVMAGSTLESHLRKLAIKNEIPTTLESGKPKNGNGLNQDLLGAEVYALLDQKSINGWIDIRNNAAHGLYDKYTKEQVVLLISGIQNFILRNPA